MQGGTSELSMVALLMALLTASDTFQELGKYIDLLYFHLDLDVCNS